MKPGRCESVVNDESSSSVQLVSKYRSSQSPCVGAVNSELVGSSCNRMEYYVCCSVFIQRFYSVIGDGMFTLSPVCFLSGTLVVVRAYGQVDSAFCSLGET